MPTREQPPQAASRHPAAVVTLDAYVRVSAVRGRGGDSFISPAVQRERIAAWAKSQGHRIARVHEELDVSGATVDRPKLNEALRRIEAGETGGIVVLKLDRFGRTLIDSLALIERIRAAGGTFASVSDGFDLSTENGRLVMRIMLSLAEWELERIRANWADARERAVARGLHLTATVPFGYRRGEDGRLAPDPVTEPIVRELFERRAAGAGWADLRRWLEGQGAKTQRGRDVWSLRAMRDIIRNDVYLGVASHGEFRQEDAHAALTDHSTWRRAQRRGRQTSSRAAEPALLSGLLRCAGCRYVMRAATRKLADGSTVHDYRCRCGAEQAGRCQEQATATGTDGIEELVVGTFFERVSDMHMAAAAEGSRLAELAAERDRVREALEAYAADTRIQEAAGMDAYVAGLLVRKAAYEAAQAAVDAEEEAAEALPVAEDVMSLRDDWLTFSVDERRRLLGLAIDCVFVRRRSRREPLAERMYVCWRGEAPAELPGQGIRGYAPKPWLFPDPSDTGVALAQNGEVSRGDCVPDLAV